MRTFRTHMQAIEVIDSITCDLCKGVFHEEANMSHLEKSFGYEAIHFSDMDFVSVDLCETCLFDFLNTHHLLKPCVTPYYKINKECLNE